MTDFEQFAERIDGFLPGISIDCVLLGYKDAALQVLLLKWKNFEAWSLPGGFVKKEETLEEAVGRVLYERTGLKNIFLQQFHTFSGLSRQIDGTKMHLKESPVERVFGSLPEKPKEKVKHWLSQRFISTGFLALVDMNKVAPVPDFMSEACTWLDIDQLPVLILDHRIILSKALEHIRIQLNYLPVARELLPEKFTMKELQSLYEAILQKQLDRGNFQRKMLNLHMLKRHEKRMTGAANKAPYLYSFDDNIYMNLLEEGIGFTPR